MRTLCKGQTSARENIKPWSEKSIWPKIFAESVTLWKMTSEDGGITTWERGRGRCFPVSATTKGKNNILHIFMHNQKMHKEIVRKLSLPCYGMNVPNCSKSDFVGQ